MNHIYRVVFNHATGTYQCVSEFAKARGKTKSVKTLALAIGIILTSNAGAVIYEGDIRLTDGELTYGTLEIRKGATVQAGTLNIHKMLGADGEALIHENSHLKLNGDLKIGKSSTGVLTLDDNNNDPTQQNSSVELARTLTIGKDKPITTSTNPVENASFVNVFGNHTLTAHHAIVGKEGNGYLTVWRNQDNENIKFNRLDIGGTANTNETGTGTVSLVGADIQAETIYVGNAGKGTFNAKDGSYIRGELLQIGMEKGGTGELTLQNNSVARLTDIVVGGAGTGKLVAKNNDSSIVADTLTIAAKTGSRGDVLIEDNAYLEVQDITVGEQGVGNLTFKQLWQIHPIQNITLGKSQTGVGTLHLDTETSTAINTITVGEQGQGVLKITGTDKQPAMLEVHQIQRSPDAQRSEIHLNGAGLVFTQDQNNLFAGFNQNNKIEIGKEGLWVQMGDLHRDDTPANVIINPEAVITGDVGQTVAVTIDEQNEFVSGGFIMNGSGMLTLSENSKKFTGDIGAIDGTLKIDGNLKMAGENLVIGISDYNEDSKIIKMTVMAK